MQSRARSPKVSRSSLGGNSPMQSRISPARSRNSGDLLDIRARSPRPSRLTNTTTTTDHPDTRGAAQQPSRPTRASVSDRILSLAAPKSTSTGLVSPKRERGEANTSAPPKRESRNSFRGVQRHSVSALNVTSHIPASATAPNSVSRQSVSSTEKQTFEPAKPRQRLSLTRSSAIGTVAPNRPTIQRGGSARELRGSRASIGHAPPIRKTPSASDSRPTRTSNPQRSSRSRISGISATQPSSKTSTSPSSFSYVPTDFSTPDVQKLREELASVQAQLHAEKEWREKLEIDTEHLRMENELLSVKVQVLQGSTTGGAAPSGSVDSALRLDHLESVLLDMLMRLETAKTSQ